MAYIDDSTEPPPPSPPAAELQDIAAAQPSPLPKRSSVIRGEDLAARGINAFLPPPPQPAPAHPVSRAIASRYVPDTLPYRGERLPAYDARQRDELDFADRMQRRANAEERSVNAEERAQNREDRAAAHASAIPGLKITDPAKEREKLDAQAASALAAPIAEAHAAHRTAAQAAKLSAKTTAARLAELGAAGVDPTDIPTARGQIENAFNAEYSSDPANAKPLFGGGRYTPEAQVLRDDITKRKAEALTVVGAHGEALANAKDAQEHLVGLVRERSDLHSGKLAAVNARREAAGLQPVGQEGTTAAIPGLEDQKNSVVEHSTVAIPGLNSGIVEGTDGESGSVDLDPNQPVQKNGEILQQPSQDAPNGSPQAEGVFGSLVRPIATGIVPAAATAAVGIGAAALAGTVTAPTGPGAIAAAITADIAGGAAGGALAEKAQNAVMGGEWTKENQAQLAANMAEHPIAAKIGAFIPAIISMLGGGGGKVVREAGADITKAVGRWLGHTAERTAENPAWLARSIAALPESMTLGARMGAGAAAQAAAGGQGDYSDVFGEAIKGAVTMGPVAFIPAAGTILGGVLGKAPADAAMLATANALYEKAIHGKDIDGEQLAKDIGTDIPGFALMALITGFTHGHPFRAPKAPPEEPAASGATPAPEPPAAPPAAEQTPPTKKPAPTESRAEPTNTGPGEVSSSSPSAIPGMEPGQTETIPSVSQEKPDPVAELADLRTRVQRTPTSAMDAALLTAEKTRISELETTTGIGNPVHRATIGESEPIAASTSEANFPTERNSSDETEPAAPSAQAIPGLPTFPTPEAATPTPVAQSAPPSKPSAQTVRSQDASSSGASVESPAATQPPAHIQGIPDSILADAKFLSDIAITEPFQKHGIGGLDVPTQRVVKAHVFRAAKNPQILNAIVRLLPVDVVNVLRARQLTPEMALHDEAVFEELFSIDPKTPVSLSVEVSNRIIRSVVGMMADPTAKNAASSDDGRRLSSERGSAVGTNDIHKKETSGIIGGVSSGKTVSDDKSHTPPTAEGTQPAAAGAKTPLEQGREATRIATAQGLRYQGESLGLHAFIDPQTGGNFSVKTAQLSPETVANKLSKLRESFAESSPELPATPGASEAPLSTVNGGGQPPVSAENDEAITLYHASPKRFDLFDSGMATPTGLGERGHYFSDSKPNTEAGAYGANIKTIRVPKSKLANLEEVEKLPEVKNAGNVDAKLRQLGYEGTYNPLTKEYVLYDPNKFLSSTKTDAPEKVGSDQTVVGPSAGEGAPSAIPGIRLSEPPPKAASHAPARPKDSGPPKPKAETAAVSEPPTKASDKSVRDHPIRAVRKGDEITVVMKYGPKLNFSVSEMAEMTDWERKGSIEKKTAHWDEEPGGFGQASRLRDGVRNVIRQLVPPKPSFQDRIDAAKKEKPSAIPGLKLSAPASPTPETKSSDEAPTIESYGQKYVREKGREKAQDRVDELDRVFNDKSASGDLKSARNAADEAENIRKAIADEAPAKGAETPKPNRVEAEQFPLIPEPADQITTIVAGQAEKLPAPEVAKESPKADAKTKDAPVEWRLPKAKGYSGIRAAKSYIAQITGTDAKFGLSREFRDADEVDWGDSKLFKKSKGAWSEIHRPAPGLYEFNAHGEKEFRIVWEQDGAMKWARVDKARATAIAEALENNVSFDEARKQTRPPKADNPPPFEAKLETDPSESPNTEPKKESTPRKPHEIANDPSAIERLQFAPGTTHVQATRTGRDKPDAPVPLKDLDTLRGGGPYKRIVGLDRKGNETGKPEVISPKTSADAAYDFADSPIVKKAIHSLNLAEQELNRRIAANRANQTLPRARGLDAISSRIEQEINRRGGELGLDRGQLDDLRTFAKAVGGQMVDDVALSVKASHPESGRMGNFDFADRIVTIYTGAMQRGEFTRTGVHELWHALSRYVPDSEVRGVEKEFQGARADFIKKNVWAAALGKGDWGDREFSEQLYKTLREKFPEMAKYFKEIKTERPGGKDKLTYKLRATEETYRLFNPDEYFAETLKDRVMRDVLPDENRTFWQRAKDWFARIYDGIKAAVGLDKTGAIYAKFMAGKYEELQRDSAMSRLSTSKDFRMAREEQEEPHPSSAQPREEDGGFAAHTLDSLTRKAAPGLNILRDIKGGIQSLLLPSMKSPEHLAEAERLGADLGAMNRRQESSRAQTAPDWKSFARMGLDRIGLSPAKNAGLQFMSAMSQGRSMGEKLQAVADKIKGQFQDRLDALEKVGANLHTILDNYFPGMWTGESRRAFNLAMEEARKAGVIPEEGFDVNGATAEQKAWVKARTDKALAKGEGSEADQFSYLTKRPLKGKESFRKQKVFDDIMDAAEFGLRPFSHNPIDLVNLKLAEMDRSLMANEHFAKLKDAGKLKLIDPYEEVPEGWVKLNDKYGTQYGPPTTKLAEHVDKAVYDGLAAVAKGLGIDHERLVKFPSGQGSRALGLSLTGQDKVLSRFGTETSVIAHEIGHQLDDKYGMWDLLTGGGSGSKRTPAQTELRAIADMTGRGDYSRKKAEKMAQVLEAYIHAPEKMKEVAPTIFKTFDDFVRSKPELKALSDIRPGLELKKLDNEKYVGLPIIGYRIVPKEVGDVLNNYLSSSLYNSPYFGAMYKGWMGLASALNQAQLGVGSAFHAGFTAIESQLSAGANLFKDIYGVARGNRTLGQLGETARNFGTAMGQFYTVGDRLINAWRNPDAVIDERTRALVRAVELAGGGFTMERGMETAQTAKAFSAFHSGKLGEAALRSPVAALELMARPMMHYLVPRQKAAVFAHLAGRIIEQNPEKSLEELTPEFRQAWNRTDARLGQVRYDRLFMVNAAKNAIQGLVRAPGWTGGTLAELGGAFKDTAKFFADWKRDGKPPADIPDRVAYTASLLLGVAAANAVLTYAFTGQQPKDLDYWAFRTGGDDEHGNPERFILPSYMKDLLSYAKEPLTTIGNKSHPLLALIHDLWKNQDYYGVKIRNEDDSALQKAADSGKYFVKAFEPFWIRGAQRERERGGGIAKQAASFIGVMPAPKKMTQTPAEALADQYAHDTIPIGGRTQAQADASRVRYQLVEKLRRHEPADFQTAMKSGAIQAKDIPAIRARAQMTPIQYQVKKLSLDKAEAVYRAASADEKRQLLPILTQKRANAVQAAGRPAGASAFVMR